MTAEGCGAERILMLAWPPRKEDLEHLYVEDELSAAKIAVAYGLRYASPKTAESTILHHLKKNGINRRDASAHIRKVTETMVDERIVRYRKGESLKQISGDSVDPVTVFYHLHRRGCNYETKSKLKSRRSRFTRRDPSLAAPLTWNTYAASP